MCYAVSNTKTQKEIEEISKTRWQSKEPYKPYFHLSAFSYPNLHVQTIDTLMYIENATWGFVPESAFKDVHSFRKKYHTFNARAEDLWDSKIYAEAVNTQRCLIWADGFFEPYRINNQGIPYYCHQPDTSKSNNSQLFAFAGLYSKTENNALTCTIITTKANDFFAEIHNVKKRMPLVLSNQFYQYWLDPEANMHQIKDLLNDGFTNETFEAHPVSSRVYNKNIDTNIPDILNEVDKGTLF
jgi:putative SOS response-associated peptidase YedK